MSDSDIKKGDLKGSSGMVPPETPQVFERGNDHIGAGTLPPEIPQVLSNQNGSSRILTGVVTSKQNPNSSKTSDTNDG